ncbi:MAG TPA: MarR family transcriptional regulator [Candidatus Dormibacteraeota bacterium]|nr:MarR family transcriptional regulator [Candidatus Dormibacteraeota bacterium]
MTRGSVDEALIGYRKLHRAILTSTASRWRDLDISMQQLRAIYMLRDEEVATVGRLAELFGIGLPSASVLADRLVRAGYVERSEDTADRRRVLLTLTRAGIQLVTELQEGSHLLLRRWMARLTPEDLAALTRGWQALAEVASRHGQPLPASVL